MLLDGNFPVAERFVKAGSLEGKSLGPKGSRARRFSLPGPFPFYGRPQKGVGRSEWRILGWASKRTRQVLKLAGEFCVYYLYVSDEA